MRVLYILTKLELGGAQKVCLTLFHGITGEHCEASLVSGADGILVDEVSHCKNVYLLQEFKREIGIKLVPYEIKAFFSLYKIIKKIKKDDPQLVVHTHSTKAGVFGRWASFFAGVKIRVHTVHGFGFHDFLSKPKWFALFLAEYISSFITTHYICVSEKDRATGIKKIPGFAQKSSIIRAAVDWDHFYLPARKEKTFSQKVIIGTVSCFKQQKNLIDLLRAFSALCLRLSPIERERVFLHVVGDGILRAELEAFVHARGLADRVVFFGWQADVSPFMKGWDIFAMSSLWEGLPCAIVEARLAKLPVVAYDVGGIGEIIRDGINGFLIQRGDWQALSDQLLLLVKDKQLRLNMSLPEESGLDAFKNSSMIREHEQLYARLTLHK